MNDELNALLARARLHRPSEEERAEQALENASANGALSDSRITRETMKATATIIAQAEKPEDD